MAAAVGWTGAHGLLAIWVFKWKVAAAQAVYSRVFIVTKRRVRQCILSYY